MLRGFLSCFVLLLCNVDLVWHFDQLVGEESAGCIAIFLIALSVKLSYALLIYIWYQYNRYKPSSPPTIFTTGCSKAMVLALSMFCVALCYGAFCHALTYCCVMWILSGILISSLVRRALVSLLFFSLYVKYSD